MSTSSVQLDPTAQVAVEQTSSIAKRDLDTTALVALQHQRVTHARKDSHALEGQTIKWPALSNRDGIVRSESHRIQPLGSSAPQGTGVRASRLQCSCAQHRGDASVQRVPHRSKGTSAPRVGGAEVGRRISNLAQQLRVGCVERDQPVGTGKLVPLGTSVKGGARMK